MTALLDFVTPPLGLAPHTKFRLEPIGGADGLFSLGAIADDGLRLYVVDPQTVVADYSPILTDEHVDSLGLTAPDDALLLVVASHTDEGVHVNLLAPIVANKQTGATAQVILEGQDYPLRARLS
ncbi:flagellar assembly protein FliW [Microbacterium sp. nov. GSS16]|uniref:flagellar assembly protein FliW n=1 Tax=Microbacterium sp. nov. GSS16 TaxID=3019890 RepID=UPI0023058B94|nr:flagellar assembly protein FliW [Microbacterium sp. nov. GSS16]WCD92842.1 flagellar assembly protein FliW [Microbacterium sp. nov. GSS16]